MNILRFSTILLSILLISSQSLAADIGNCPTQDQSKTEGDTLNQKISQSAKNLGNDMLCDFSIYLGKDNLLDLGSVFLITGIMANTHIDRSLSHAWEKGIRNGFTNTFFKLPHEIGTFNYVAPYLLSMAIGHWQSDTPTGLTFYNWGYRSIRTLFLVGIQDP